MKEIYYKGDWALVDAYFYKFWIHIDEFKKFKVQR